MKNILKFFHLGHKKTAKTAKERLQIVVSHQRVNDTSPEFLPSLRKELLDVICKYISIDIDQINVNLQRDGNCSILELNVTIPEPLQNLNSSFKKEPFIKEEAGNMASASKKQHQVANESEEEDALDVEIADV